MKNRAFTFLVLAFLVGNCTKETDPQAVERAFFGCFDSKTFGDLKPEKFDGLPETCAFSLLEDAFDDNKTGWADGETNDRDFEISGGAYHLTVKSNGGWYPARQFDQMNGHDDFQIDARILIVDSGDSDPFSSIVWKGEAWQFLNFGISDDQTFVIRERTSQSEPFKILVASTFSNSIKTSDWNVLSIRRFDSKTYFFINQTLVADLPDLPDFGNDTGFFLPGQSQTDIDFLKIKSWSL